MKRSGYVNCHLDLKDYRKHRIIAIQWIENPNNYDMVDHINRDKLDNHVSNLRWINNRKNQQNCIKHKGVKCRYVDNLPNDAAPLLRYNNSIFDSYYIDGNNDIYHYNQSQYRIFPGMLRLSL